MSSSDKNSSLLTTVPGLTEAFMELVRIDNTAFQHAAMGAIKNLIKLPAHKLLFRSAGLVCSLFIMTSLYIMSSLINISTMMSFFLIAFS